MTTQEKLEAFAPYLPYGVFVKTDYDSVFKMGIVNNISFSRTIDVIIENDYKPILRPLSDLTNPCLEGGNIPIVELANMLGYHNLDIFEIDGELQYGWSVSLGDDYQGYAFGWSQELKTFGIWYDSVEVAPIETVCTLDAIKQLYKWHFWLGDQSEFGKSIIDINTIKTE